jgi:hypothetical protein
MDSGDKNTLPLDRSPISFAPAMEAVGLANSVTETIYLTPGAGTVTLQVDLKNIDLFRMDPAWRSWLYDLIDVFEKGQNLSALGKAGSVKNPLVGKS